jgi:hypothetical protein
LLDVRSKVMSVGVALRLSSRGTSPYTAEPLSRAHRRPGSTKTVGSAIHVPQASNPRRKF